MAGELQRRVGANLRAYRERRGLSQEAFAEVLGVHRTYMGGVERGERNLTLQTVERLAENIGVRATDLLGVTGKTATRGGHPRRRGGSRP